MENTKTNQQILEIINRHKTIMWDLYGKTVFSISEQNYQSLANDIEKFIQQRETEAWEEGYGKQGEEIFGSTEQRQEG